MKLLFFTSRTILIHNIEEALTFQKNIILATNTGLSTLIEKALF